MPELPEVETIKRTLEPCLVGKKVVKVDLYLDKALKLATLEKLCSVIEGAKIKELLRRGKHLILRFSSGYDLVFHLRMTGRLLYLKLDDELPKHTTAVFTLSGQRKLIFGDVRKFGTIHLVPASHWDEVSSLRRIGPEPLEANFTYDYFYQGLQRKTKIKPLLLDQTFIAGLGNIYVDESLYKAGIHPERAGNTLSKAEAKRLYQAIKETIASGVQHRGTSVSDYLDGLGQKGEFQNLLQVYQKKGETCPVCGTLIERLKVGGRSSHICPGCQRRKD